MEDGDDGDEIDDKEGGKRREQSLSHSMIHATRSSFMLNDDEDFIDYVFGREQRRLLTLQSVAKACESRHSPVPHSQVEEIRNIETGRSTQITTRQSMG